MFAFMSNEWHHELQRILKARKISLRAFSDLIDMSEGYTKTMLKNGSDIKISTAIKICRALNLPMTFFVDGRADEAELASFTTRFSLLNQERKHAVNAYIRHLDEPEGDR